MLGSILFQRPLLLRSLLCTLGFQMFEDVSGLGFISISAMVRVNWRLILPLFDRISNSL